MSAKPNAVSYWESWTEGEPAAVHVHMVVTHADLKHWSLRRLADLKRGTRLLKGVFDPEHAE